jgi:hypothetical protein
MFAVAVPAVGSASAKLLLVSQQVGELKGIDYDVLNFFAVLPPALSLGGEANFAGAGTTFTTTEAGLAGAEAQNVIRVEFAAAEAEVTLPYRQGVNYSFTTFNESLGAAPARSEGILAAISEPTKEANYIYRGLAQGEDIANGLVARLPNAGNDAISHVVGREASQWISTTKSETIALEKYGENGVVRIDLNGVSSPVLDVSGGFPGKPGMISNWAIKDQEVLIQNFVPPQAITRIR